MRPGSPKECVFIHPSVHPSDIDTEAAIQAHIELLHRYNDMKDAGQLLIGRIAEIEGTTTKALYTAFGLELSD